MPAVSYDRCELLCLDLPKAEALRARRPSEAFARDAITDAGRALLAAVAVGAEVAR